MVVSPGVCPLPTKAPTWGWAVQLYAVRSADSWGMGDLGDLRRLGRWAARDLGAGLVLVNPLHAAHPTLPQSTSPYFPSSRRFRNPLYLRVGDVDGAGALDNLGELAAAGRALNGDRLIDRDAVFRLKMRALEALWDRFPGDPAFDAWRQAQGDALGDYAAFCVLAEEHGADWRQWPDAARHPGGAAGAEVRRTQYGRWRFHQWLQWLVDRQLQNASAAIDVMHDLAVGVDPAGADGWLWQDHLALDMAVGAPPDEFSTQGQSWGLPPFDPWRLRTAGYEPFIQTIRATLGHAGGLRIDHVMGLFRLWWVPRDAASPAEGAYVRYPAEDLLDIVALECHRAGAYAVGEDLGTVEDHVREELARRAVLSYRLVWFEDDPPAEYPEQGPGRRHHPRPADHRRALDRQRPRRPEAHRRRAERGGDAGPAGPAPTRGRALPRTLRSTRWSPPPTSVLSDAPCLLLTAGLDDALGVAGAAQHAGNARRVAQLAHRPAHPAGGDRGRPPAPRRRRRPRPPGRSTVTHSSIAAAGGAGAPAGTSGRGPKAPGARWRER